MVCLYGGILREALAQIICKLQRPGIHRPLNSVPMPLHTAPCGPAKAPTTTTPVGEPQQYSQAAPPVALPPLHKLLHSRTGRIALLKLRPDERAPAPFPTARSMPMY